MSWLIILLYTSPALGAMAWVKAGQLHPSSNPRASIFATEGRDVGMIAVLLSGRVHLAAAYPEPAPLQQEWRNPSAACNGALGFLSGGCLIVALLSQQAYIPQAYRHPIPMQEEWPEFVKHATGHGQFWVLIRKHAEIVNADTFVERLFSRHCFTSLSE